MDAPEPEFSRPLKVDRVPRGGSFEKLEADPMERRRLAGRLGLEGLHALTAQLRASPWRGGGLKVEGSLKAEIEQVSVVSLEAFRTDVEYPVLRYFMPSAVDAADAEAEIDPIVDGHVDLGELVAETLAIELDPYPRRPGEAFAETVDPVTEPPAPVSPFAGLSRLKP